MGRATLTRRPLGGGTRIAVRGKKNVPVQNSESCMACHSAPHLTATAAPLSLIALFVAPSTTTDTGHRVRLVQVIAMAALLGVVLGGVNCGEDLTTTPPPPDSTPNRIAFTVQPTTVDAGAAMAPAVQTSVQDAQGKLVTTSTADITVAISSGTGPAGAVLDGTLTRTAHNGVATFDDLAIDRAGAGYTLTATATGLTSATSAAFNVAPTIEAVAGAYHATTFAVLQAGATTNLLAAGGLIALTLTVDGTTSGRVFVPGGGESGEDFEADLAGTWTLEGWTVTLDHPADTFLRDVSFAVHGHQLSSEATFSDVTITVVLAK